MAPVVAIQSPLHGLKVQNAGTLAIQYTAVDETGGSGLVDVHADLDGAAVVNNANVDLGTLGVGAHTLTVVASDRAGNSAIAQATFTVETQQQAVQSIGDGIQATILSPDTPAEARPLLQDALDQIVGNNGGRSANGAIALMNAGNVIGAMVKLQKAERDLRLAQDKGAATAVLQRELADFVRLVMIARVAHLEALILADPGVDPDNKIPQVRAYMANAAAAFDAANYESALLNWRQAEQRVLQLDQEAPIVTILEPEDLLAHTKRPKILAAFADDLGLIATAGVRIYLDGFDRTNEATVRPYEVVLVVQASFELAEGSHTVRVVAPDSAGNLADVTRTLVVSLVPVILQEPANNAIRIGARGSVFGHSGEFTITATDMGIPGRGLPFAVIRTYRSGSSYNGPLGYGWDFTYNERLSGTSGADVTRFDGTGRSDRYAWNEGTWTAPAGFYDRLTFDGASDTFTITDRYGTVRRFARRGTLYRLSELRDLNENSLSFHYNTEDQLDIVTDTLGREVHFTYTPEGRIDFFTDFYDPLAPRKVDFGYDANGDLRTATSPAVTGTPNGNDFPLGKTTQ
ncbi:MAG: DUF6531 domain-containing protein, partial [Planctomycetota bacterium]